MKPKILILGASGMLGACVTDIFLKTKKYDLTVTIRKDSYNSEFTKEYDFSVLFFDAKKDRLEDLKITKQDYIINCIGAIPQRKCDVSSMVEINALFPHKLAKYSEENNSIVFQIATDCVFSGGLGYYIETKEHDSHSVYGKAKSLGEVQDDFFKNLRCSIVGIEPNNNYSLMGYVLSIPIGGQIDGYVTHYWNGITVLHFAKILDAVISNNLVLPNLLHIVPKDIVTKFELIHIIRNVFKRNDITVKVSVVDTIDRTLSTDYEQINLDLWQKLGYSDVPSIEKLIEEYGNYYENSNRVWYPARNY